MKLEFFCNYLIYVIILFVSLFCILYYCVHILYYLCNYVYVIILKLTEKIYTYIFVYLLKYSCMFIIWHNY